MINAMPELTTAIAPIRAGKYEARFAMTADEIRQAQTLRYDVMYAEKGGHPDLKKVHAHADIDEWDDQAFHIVVIDHSNSAVVGTLRLVCSERLAAGQKFYTELAFNIDALRGRYPVLLELGRFCIHPAGRNGAILMLIWKYAMNFISDNPIDVMIGCASFAGTDIADHVDVLTWLYHRNRAPDSLMPRPVVDHVCLKDVVRESVEFDDATRMVPPLLRGYLKLGARASDTAIIDPVFQTTFVAIYVDAAAMLSEDTVLVSSRRR